MILRRKFFFPPEEMKNPPEEIPNFLRGIFF